MLRRSFFFPPGPKKSKKIKKKCDFFGNGLENHGMRSYIINSVCREKGGGSPIRCSMRSLPGDTQPS
jgi:hypothetical protein